MWFNYTKKFKVKSLHQDITGHFIRYTFLIMSQTSFCLQSCLKSLQHRLIRVLQLWRGWRWVHIHDVNIPPHVRGVRFDLGTVGDFEWTHCYVQETIFMFQRIWAHGLLSCLTSQEPRLVNCSHKRRHRQCFLLFKFSEPVASVSCSYRRCAWCGFLLL